MDQFIIQILQGSASDSVRQRVEEWRRASPENDAHYREIEHLWRATSGSVDHHPVGAPPAARTIAALAADRRAVRQVPRVAVAAVVALALAGAGWIGLAWLNQPLITVTAAGDQTVTLPDGSFVRLADGTRLEYRARRGRRLVELDGRAFFAVASDSSREFRISSGGAGVSVLGTRFDVFPRGDSLRVAVTEGLVVLARGGEARRLPTGTVGVAHPGGVRIDSMLSATTAIDWARPFFLFHNTPVIDAISEINARTGGRVVVTDSVIADRLVTAQFADESVDDVVSTICVIVNARCTTVRGETRMSR